MCSLSHRTMAQKVFLLLVVPVYVRHSYEHLRPVLLPHRADLEVLVLQQLALEADAHLQVGAAVAHAVISFFSKNMKQFYLREIRSTVYFANVPYFLLGPKAVSRADDPAIAHANKSAKYN